MLIGSFNNWTERLHMEKRGANDFLHNIKLERKTYQYKFIVDGNWRFASD